MCGNHPMILKNAKINSNYMYSPTYFVTIMPVIYFYEKGNQKWFSFSCFNNKVIYYIFLGELHKTSHFD